VEIRILTSCTSTKRTQCPDPLTIEDFKRGEDYLQRQEKQLAQYALPAGQMYAGRQHQELMKGVQALRSVSSSIAVSVEIISAGYGVIPEDRHIVPYDVSFSDLKGADAIKEWARQRSIPEDVEAFLGAPADLKMILLGEKYSAAAQIESAAQVVGPTLYLSNPKGVSRLPDLPNLKKVAVRQADASRFSEGIVWLKGHLARLILHRVAQYPDAVERLTAPESDVLDLLEKQKKESQTASLGF
jgi:hypothetical protein